MQTILHYFDLRVVTGICFSLSTVCCFILETSIAIDDLLPVVTIIEVSYVVPESEQVSHVVSESEPEQASHIVSESESEEVSRAVSESEPEQVGDNLFDDLLSVNL